MSTDGTLNSKFSKIDLGTKVSTAQLDTIEVTVDPNLMVKQYAEATVARMQELNPTKFNSLEISVDLIFKYFAFLILSRVQQITGSLSYFRELQKMWIPVWVQFAISCVGEVIIQDYGLRLIPVAPTDFKLISKEEALQVSDLLAKFERDGLSIIQDAFPRTRNGDQETMAFAIVDKYVFGMKPDLHPLKSYVAAFLGQKLVQSQALGALYRCRYDDVNYVASQLLRENVLYCSDS